MRVRTFGAAVAALVAGGVMAPALPAQTVAPACVNQGLLQDACQQAADLFAFMAPQIGASIAGGNATLGQGGNLGGLGHFSLSVRATGLRGELPDVAGTPVTLGAARESTFDVDDQWVGLPQVDVGIGLYKGIPLAISNVGGVDLLLSGSWVPEVTQSDFELRAPGGSFRVGVGARLGILQESFTVPGVSVTYLRRGLPDLDLRGRAGDDTLAVTGASLTVDSWRLVASKHFLAFGVAGGIGQDRFDADASVSAIVNEGGVRSAIETPVPFSQRLTRTNVFANLSMNLAIFRLVGEIGHTSGGDAPTFNRFAGTSAAESRLYGSVGLRVGI